MSDPGDYDGGELVIQNTYDEQEVKLPAGAAVVYPSGALHRVAAVARGVRLAAVTRVESFVRDPARREALHDLDMIRRKMPEILVGGRRRRVRQGNERFLDGLAPIPAMRGGHSAKHKNVRCQIQLRTCWPWSRIEGFQPGRATQTAKTCIQLI